MTMQRLIGAIVFFATFARAQAQDNEWRWDEAVGGVDTVFLEEMTAGEIAQAVRGGATTAIIPSGGLEQNGPYLATGKHNYVVRQMADGIARELKNTLVTATVKFVPQGNHQPATDQMRYAGTISLRTETYEAVLVDIARSLKAHGVKEVILIGDSGGGQQESMARVAEALENEWSDEGVNVWHFPEFYEKDKNAAAFLEQKLNIKQDPITDIHTDYRYEAVMAVADPHTIRAEQRIAADDFATRGVDIGTVERMQEHGRKLIEYRSHMIADLIRNRREQEE